MESCRASRCRRMQTCRRDASDHCGIAHGTSFRQGQAPVCRRATRRAGRGINQRSGALETRSGNQMDESTGSEDSRIVSNHRGSASRGMPCGGCPVLHQEFARVAHISPGERRSVGSNPITRVVKETLGKCRLEIRPRFAPNMYGSAPLRRLITQVDETIPVAPRSFRDRRSLPPRRPPADSACAAAGRRGHATRRRFPRVRPRKTAARAA